VLCRGGAEAAATAGAERAADAAEANLLENLPEKLDEFGRDENVELREEMSRRASKRTAQYSTPPAQPQVCFFKYLVLIGLLYKAHTDACQHRFASAAEVEALPREAAPALVSATGLFNH